MDFAGIIDSWRRVLAQPGEEVFQQEKRNPNATLANAIIWMVIAGVIAGILSFIQTAIFGSAAAAMMGDLPPEIAGQLGALTGGGLGLWAIIFTPLFFVIGVVLLHAVAKALGGVGEMGTIAYLLSLINAPITIVGAILAFIPLLGACVGFLLGIYALVLNFFAIKANYNLETGRAIAVLVVYILVATVLSACIAGALIAPAIMSA
jgi:hypothetical protein